MLFKLVIRQIEGVLTAARHDLVLLPAAFACARAALETAAKATSPKQGSEYGFAWGGVER